MAEDWESLVSAARRDRDASIAAVKPAIPSLQEHTLRDVTGVPRFYLSDCEIGLTETSVPALIKGLANGTFRAVDVTNAFLRRAAIAQKLVNCVFELVPEDALARAHELDAFYQKNQRPIGPLHGLPVSLKALFPWPGRRSTEGFVANLADTCTKDASVVAIIKSLGAIPFARTTQCQGVMMLENIAPTHGSTTNPHNTDLTPGGSSGGEGALLGLLGSPLGIGTDIGGSIRSPAANCGLYALKPSCFRLPMTGLHVYFTGSDMILGTMGPITPSRKGISIFMKSVLDTRPWENDPSLLPIPWRTLDSPFTPTLNVGILWDDGVVKPSRAMTRALDEVVARLELSPRVKVTKWEPFQHDEGIRILEKLYSPDGGETFKKALAKSGEPMHELTDYRLVSGPGVKSLSVKECWDWAAARNGYRYRYLQEWMSKSPDMHVILCPPHAGAAPPIGTSKYWGYTSIWNLLDYPATVFPVTAVDPSLDREEVDYVPRNEIDAWTHRHFDASKQAGAPICLQLVGKRLEEEKVVQAMDLICEVANLPFTDAFKTF